jgi:hypothetical protein
METLLYLILLNIEFYVQSVADNSGAKVSVSVFGNKK